MTWLILCLTVAFTLYKIMYFITFKCNCPHLICVKLACLIKSTAFHSFKTSILNILHGIWILRSTKQKKLKIYYYNFCYFLSQTINISQTTAIPNFNGGDGNGGSTLLSINFQHFTHICPMDFSILINWMSPFPILGVSDVLFRFYFISNRNSSQQIE